MSWNSSWNKYLNPYLLSLKFTGYLGHWGRRLKNDNSYLSAYKAGPYLAFYSMYLGGPGSSYQPGLKSWATICLNPVMFILLLW